MIACHRTKIVSTLGPATSAKDEILSLINAGANIFRLNASHGTHEEHLSRINVIKALRTELNKPIAILFDIQGPKIRVGKLENGLPVKLIEGNEIKITSRQLVGNAKCISTNYPDIANDVKPGDKILLNDGIFVLEVKEIIDKDVVTVILAGGELSEHKGVNIPGTTNSLSVISEKDKKDIAFAIENKVDYIGLSFVRTSKDISDVKQLISMLGGDIPVIAKIEKPQALENIDEIIEISDGIMVARGDLGIELAPEKVPLAQKMLIKQAVSNNKFVITATQMLESMVNNPLPTRAEVSDVANAILDGTDAVMLSEETSVGKYPAKSVQMMVKIAKELECEDTIPINKFAPKLNKNIIPDSYAIAHSVVEMSKDLKPSFIVAITSSGYTASLISRFKPHVPVVAITHHEEVFRKLSVYWGVYPYILDINKFDESLIEKLNILLKETFSLSAGDKIIIVGGKPYLVPGIVNFIRIHQIY